MKVHFCLFFLVKKKKPTESGESNRDPDKRNKKEKYGDSEE